MPQETAISVSNDTLEELRCFMCKRYLSCSPVRLLCNGNYICGRCSPSSTDEPVYRLLPFEAVLKEISFPCIYNKYGCEEKLLFEHTVDHESTCILRPFTCPVNLIATCSWEGPLSQLLEHFVSQHPDFLKENVEFELQLDQNGRGILATSEDSFAVFVRYSYETSKNLLKYDTRVYMDKNEFDVFSKVRLVNNDHPERTVDLKSSECLPFDRSFYEIQGDVLDLSKFLDSLGEPRIVRILMQLKQYQLNEDKVTLKNGLQFWSLDWISQLRCNDCQNYLVPPLFDAECGVICSNCVENHSACIPLKDKDLLKLVNEAVYPCRWHGCSFESPSTGYKDHEKSCQFRFYHCVFSDCDVTFKLSAVADHFRQHRLGLCQSDAISYKMSFAKSYSFQDIITIKNNRIILLRHETVDTETPFMHRINVYRSRDDSALLSGTVEFEHEHCKLKSKPFIIAPGKTVDIDIKKLPFCFKEKEKLTVLIKLNL